MTTEAAPKDKAVATTRKTLPELLNKVDTKKMFQDMLGKDADGFMQNMLTVYNGGLKEAGCDPESIIGGAAIAASLRLSILPGLGQACLVPYKDGDRVVAQFQIMVRGVIQLAHRSGQYERVNAARVYEGQLVSYDEHKGTVTLRAEKKSDRVEGYYFWFKLKDGLTMEFYWSAKRCIEHGLRFSKSFQKGSGKWADDPEFVKAGSVKKWLEGKEHLLTEGSGADAMCAKTSVKIPLLKWGPLETKVKEQINLDQAVIQPDGTHKFIDTTAEKVEPKTYAPPPTSTTAKGPDGEPFPAEKIKWARDAAAKQGVSGEHFDKWLEQQPGDEAAKAAAAEQAWKRVAMKEIKAVDAFALKKEEPAATEYEARFQVGGHATTDIDGDPDWFAIKDSAEPPNKYITQDEAIFQAAKIARKEDRNLAVIWTPKVVGKNTLRMIVRLIA